MSTFLLLIINNVLLPIIILGSVFLVTIPPYRLINKAFKNKKEASILLFSIFLCIFSLSYLYLFITNVIISTTTNIAELLTGFVYFIGIFAGFAAFWRYLDNKGTQEEQREYERQKKHQEYYYTLINKLSKDITKDTNISELIVSIYHLRHYLFNIYDDYYFLHSLIYLKEDLPNIDINQTQKKHLEQAIDTILNEAPDQMIRMINEEIPEKYIHLREQVVELILLSLCRLLDFINENNYFNNEKREELVESLKKLKETPKTWNKLNDKAKEHLETLLKELNTGQILRFTQNDE